jgi:glycosidase
MMKRLQRTLTYLCVLLAALCFEANAQLLTWSPAFIQESSSPVEIIVDATKGNLGLKDHTPTDVYVHIGVITSLSSSSSDWKYSKFTWPGTDPNAQATYLGNNKWKYTITGGLRSFFNITNTSETIKKIAILFRSGDGNKAQRNADGSDMYVPVYDNGLHVRIDEPYRQPLYNPIPESITKNVGDNVAINAKSSLPADLKIFFNGTQVATATNATIISANPQITATGDQTIIAEATQGATVKRDTLKFVVAGAVNVAPLPSGVRDGINYESDNTAVTLVLYAPNKTRVAVLSELNNWQETAGSQMNRTPDGSRYWIRLTGLTPGVEYAYQYLIDGTLKVADYYAEKVLDPNNDQYIPSSTYPSLKPYPPGATGIVSVFQTAKPSYNWGVTNFTKPDKRNLVVYEMLLRDFVAAMNWNTLRDTLSYFKRLGVNAIQLMPFNEFEGNISWGYNPSFYFAPDKAYGTENALRQFIDTCHKNGISVIMDIALNHSCGQSPMVQMYWDAANNKPAANSPWFNQDAKHPFNVCYDMNHESQATKDFVDRVVEHWLVNYKIDGFRWDLSKGFTQYPSGNDAGLMANYDAGRIATWKRIYDKQQAVAPTSYCILEHFAVNSEETELSNYGMLLWGNSNHQFGEATKGVNLSQSNFEWFIHSARGWTNPHVVGYQESHDEERLMVKNITEGNNTNGAHNVRDTLVALKRNEMAASFFLTAPGPKMIWQFGELGYDYSINYCPNGTINNGCRTDPKPIRWDYYQKPARKALFDVYSKLIKLRLFPNYKNVFTSGIIDYNLGGAFKSLKVTGDSLKIVVIGNFGVTATTGTVAFQEPGTWYNYLTGGTRTATGSTESINLQPGEYYVFTNKDVANLVATPVRNVPNILANTKLLITPNPADKAAKVNFELPESGKLSLSVFDITGKKIATLFNGFKARGFYSINLTNNDFSASTTGTYLLVMTLNGHSRTEKFLIAK